MADFDTTAELQVTVNRQSLRAARDTIESDLGDVTVDVNAGGGGGASAQLQQSARQRSKEAALSRRLLDEQLSALNDQGDAVGEGLRLDEIRNDLLRELLEATEVGGSTADSGGGSLRFRSNDGGGGGGGLGGVGALLGLLGLGAAGAVGGAVGGSPSGGEGDAPQPTPTPGAAPAPAPQPRPVPVDAPSSIPVAEPAPVPVDSPTSIPVDSPSSIPVDAPSSIPVQQTQPFTLNTGELTSSLSTVSSLLTGVTSLANGNPAGIAGAVSGLARGGGDALGGLSSDLGTAVGGGALLGGGALGISKLLGNLGKGSAAGLLGPIALPSAIAGQAGRRARESDEQTLLERVFGDFPGPQDSTTRASIGSAGGRNSARQRREARSGGEASLQADITVRDRRDLDRKLERAKQDILSDIQNQLGGGGQF